MSDPWSVPVTALRRAPGTRTALQRTGSLGELRVADTEVVAGALVDVDVVLSSVDGGVEVVGHVGAPWVAACRRCLQPVQGVVDTEVRELYRPHSDREAADEDEETYALGVDHLDLAPMARDALLLALPLAPLCRADCAGLCPTCGADRNAESCACATGTVDPRWAGLDALRQTGGAQGGAST